MAPWPVNTKPCCRPLCDHYFNDDLGNSFQNCELAIQYLSRVVMNEVLVNFSDVYFSYVGTVSNSAFLQKSRVNVIFSPMTKIGGLDMLRLHSSGCQIVKDQSQKECNVIIIV